MDRDTSDSAIPASEQDGFQDQSGNSGGADTSTEMPEPDPKVKKFIEDWTKRIKDAKKHHEKAFKKMRKCQQLAKDGHDEEWGDEKFTTPIINRFINTAVAQLYAKNPTARAQRKRRRMNKLWDGTLQQLDEVQQAMGAAAQIGQPPDPNYVALLQEIEQIKQYDTMVDGIADTLTILTQHFVDDPAAQYKQQFKSLVRRTKVNGVAFVRLAFERVLEQDPETAVKISTATEQLDTLRRLVAEKSRDEIEDDSADMEQLKTLIQNLQNEDYILVREGPLFVFPKSTSIIIDPKCYHLKTLAGAGWYAEEFEKSPEEIEELYQKNVKGNYTQYKPEDVAGETSTRDLGDSAEQPGKVWRVMNRKTGQEFTICEGYPDYLKPPQAPDVQLSRFWDLFPLVFNEIEDDKEIYPPSDVWNARHIQSEYNRSRQGLREHRQQNRPAYITPTGAFEDEDKKKLGNHASGEVLEMQSLSPGDKITDKLQPKPVMQIDPKQYDVSELFNDLLRAVGNQQADLGPTTKSTATESQIAEQGRSMTQSDAVDDIDDMLSILFQATGELMLKNLSPQIVTQIVGQGAVWPTLDQTREQVAEEIILSVRGGSSGRPNAQMDLAKMERALPLLIQVPGSAALAKPILYKYLDTLDMDIEDTAIEGAPSIIAVNGMMQKMQQMGAPGGPPGAEAQPGAQGPQGANNAPTPAQGPQAPQVPPVHFDHQGNPIR